MGRIAIDEARLDGEASEIESEELVLVFLGAAEDFFEKIPSRGLAARRGNAGGASSWSDDMQEDELGAEMAGEGGGLMEDGEGSVREVDREEDFFESEHEAPGEEQDTIKIRV